MQLKYLHKKNYFFDVIIIYIKIMTACYVGYYNLTTKHNPNLIQAAFYPGLNDPLYQRRGDNIFKDDVNLMPKTNRPYIPKTDETFGDSFNTKLIGGRNFRRKTVGKISGGGLKLAGSGLELAGGGASGVSTQRLSNTLQLWNVHEEENCQDASHLHKSNDIRIGSSDKKRYEKAKRIKGKTHKPVKPVIHGVIRNKTPAMKLRKKMAEQYGHKKRGGCYARKKQRKRKSNKKSNEAYTYERRNQVKELLNRLR